MQPKPPSCTASKSNYAKNKTRHARKKMIESPCIKLCQLDDTGKHCIGCLRTLDELRRWGKASDEEKQSILNRLAQLETTRI
ncbi:DUF1289 domain-containing protein [Chitinibacter bivalviorum]|uniref:DUF1289 domain-containing protein n=2 Tax=Chitinibacter bivalviorum TaxID=2739434 RepID=A0A7H9BEK0_9NEIS|nr:DUF1289 domain-containing protein [Chitinibacter bivalviorum]